MTSQRSVLQWIVTCAGGKDNDFYPKNDSKPLSLRGISTGGVPNSRLSFRQKMYLNTIANTSNERFTNTITHLYVRCADVRNFKNYFQNIHWRDLSSFFKKWTQRKLGTVSSPEFWRKKYFILRLYGKSNFQVWRIPLNHWWLLTGMRCRSDPYIKSLESSLTPNFCSRITRFLSIWSRRQRLTDWQLTWWQIIFSSQCGPDFWLNWVTEVVFLSMELSILP